jgi:hypothetical protein
MLKARLGGFVGTKLGTKLGQFRDILGYFSRIESHAKHHKNPVKTALLEESTGCPTELAAQKI